MNNKDRALLRRLLKTLRRLGSPRTPPTERQNGIESVSREVREIRSSQWTKAANLPRAFRGDEDSRPAIEILAPTSHLDHVLEHLAAGRLKEAREEIVLSLQPVPRIV